MGISSLRAVTLLAVAFSGACISDFRAGIPCAVDADCQGLVCESRICVAKHAEAASFAVLTADGTALRSATALRPFTVLVRALNAAGDIELGYARTATFKSNVAGETFSATLQFTAGEATASVTLQKAGPQTLSVTDTTLPSLTGAAAVQVASGPATHLGIRGIPDLIVTNQAVSLSVVALDSAENVDTLYTGAIHVVIDDPQTTAPPDEAFAMTDAGNHILAPIKFQRTRLTKVTVSDPAGKLLSDAKTLNVTGATHLQIRGIPASIETGQAVTLTIVALDALEKIDTAYVGPIHLVTDDPQTSPVADEAFVAADAGSHTMSVIRFQSVRATKVDASDPSGKLAVDSKTLIVVGGAPAEILISGLAATVPSGIAQDFAVAVRNADHGIVTDYTGTLLLSATGATLAASSYAFVAADAGKHSFVRGVTFNSGGAQSLTARDSQVASATAKANVNVSLPPAAPAIQFAGAQSCSGSACITAGTTGLVASVITTSGSAYAWTVTNGTNTTGAAGASSGGTNSINITAGTAGTLTVTCTETNALQQPGPAGSTTLPVVAPPATPAINAPAAVTVSDTQVTASVTARGGFTYTWTVPAGVAITSAGGASGSTSGSTNIITFDAPSSPATLSLSCVERNPAQVQSTSGSASISVVAAPQITSFTGPGSPLSRGATTSLSASFSGGTGMVDNGIGAIGSGAPFTTPQLYEATIFTLTVTNAAGRSARQSVTVQVLRGTSTAISYTLASGGTMGGWLLPTNGRALVMGVSRGDVYDPSTGLFAQTANSMDGPHSDPELGLLPGGKVLIAGGGNNPGYSYTSWLYDPATNSFGSAPMASTVQVDACYGMLPNGRLLSAGGTSTLGSPGNTGTAILYDPVGNSWANATGTLPSPRECDYGPGTMLLNDGASLIVGGQYRGFSGSTGPFYQNIPQAVLFDARKSTPFSNTTGTLNAAGRLGPAIVKLPSGKVLVAGGFYIVNASTNAGLSTAELYDPSTGMFTYTAGPMASQRSSFGLGGVLLPDGRALIAAGYAMDTGTYPATADIYDPASDQFLPVPGGLRTGRTSHATILLPNGRVLIAGGSFATAEIFDPQDYTPHLWTPPPAALKLARSEATATVIGDGRVLIAGGIAADGTTPLSSELYDPGARSISAGPSLITGRTGHTATRIYTGGVLIAGGVNASGAALGAELYSFTYTQAGTLAPTTGSMSARSRHAAVALPDGRVLISGGTGSTGAVLQTADIYDPATNSFTTASMQQARAGHTATLLGDGRVLIAGGTSTGTATGALASAETFDWKTNTFSGLTQTLSTARLGHTATLDPRNGVVITGGIGSAGSVLRSTEMFDPAGNSFAAGPQLNIARSGHQAVLLPWGQILVAGGLNGSGTPIASAELLAYFDTTTTSALGIAAASRAFATVAAMGSARGKFGLALLGDGRVLAVAGTDGLTPLASLESFK
jgi:hypothetical protein